MLLILPFKITDYGGDIIIQRETALPESQRNFEYIISYRL